MQKTTWITDEEQKLMTDNWILYTLSVTVSVTVTVSIIVTVSVTVCYCICNYLLLYLLHTVKQDEITESKLNYQQSKAFNKSGYAHILFSEAHLACYRHVSQSARHIFSFSRRYTKQEKWIAVS